MAVAEGIVAEPYRVLRYKDSAKLTDRLKMIIEELGVEKVVVGVSEADMGEESKEFARRLGAETFDETLSTHEAQVLSRQAGIPRKRRKEMEDAFAAAVMLQSYLDYV